MNHLTAFRGPVTAGRYDNVRFINNDTDMTDIEIGRFGLSRENDRGEVISQFYPDAITFTVPHISDWRGLAEKRVRYFSQRWNYGGCDLSPAEAVP